MMLVFTALVLSLSQAAPSTDSTAAGSASPEIRFSFEHAQLDPATYSLVVKEDGSGHYESTPGPVSGPATDGIASAPHQRDIVIRDPLLESLFKTARSHHFFRCL